jgi:glycosyltransferase involved in cell wall biosynthesis
MQRRFLEERLHIAPERFVDAHRPVDARFWRPMDVTPELVCAVGQEMRDYGTLLEALRPTEIPCHIAVGSSIFGTTADKWWKHSLTVSSVPPNVTVGSLDSKCLRDLYARSKFIVVPLLPSNMDSGISTITEALAMGKAVIVTDTPGQPKELQSDVNCLRVPPSDPAALREAILALWDDPDRCARLGAAGRELVEAQHGLDTFAATLVQAAEEAVRSRRDRQRH